MSERKTPDLVALTHPEEAIAGPAFERLWSEIRPGLLRWLRQHGFAADAADDMVQATALRLWRTRSTLNLPSMGAWWRLALQVMRNLVIDEARKNGDAVLVEFDESIPDEDVPVLDRVLALITDVDALYERADQVWLGEADDRALLAAQLFLMDGLSEEEVCEMLELGPHESLDCWLRDPAVLRTLAFTNLYMTNDELCAFLLRVDPEDLDALDRAIVRGDAPEGWTPERTFILLRKVRNGLLTDQILRFARVTLSRNELEALFEEWSQQYPFASQADAVRQGLERIGATQTLRDSGIWRRLVFQYHAADELPYAHILERTEPAAVTVGQKMTSAMLTGWIGLGRLWTQLASTKEEAVAV